MGHDQVRAPADRLLNDILRDIQGHQNFSDLPVPPAHEKAHIVPILGALPGRQLKQGLFDFTDSWHAATPLSRTAAR